MASIAHRLLARAVLALAAVQVSAVAIGKHAGDRKGGRPPCGVQLHGGRPVSIVPTEIQPCPCLDNATREQAVTQVVQNAELIGVSKVAETATATAKTWVARIHEAAEKARESLTALRWGQVDITRKAIEQERQKEASVAWRMKETVLRANTELDAPAMTEAVAQWAQAQAHNEIFNLTNETMMELADEEDQAEELRANATSETQSMLEAAKEMAATANAAESLAWHLEHNNPVAFVNAVEAEDQKALAQVELSRKLSAKAGAAVEEASVLANSAFQRAKAAETGAAQALATAKRNTERIAVLKARVQKAQQRAVAAAAGAGVQSSR